ncbi:unnamed protein product [Sphagnum troendelagicum]|uniref:DUF4378 domain-containing protein n=1 Tax=Sphagnum troendelagicum TaxID=128251 RepID=A0ABP0U317_9BRYO
MMAVDLEFADNDPPLCCFHHVQSPRVQGCVSTFFFHLFDRNPSSGKRIASMLNRDPSSSDRLQGRQSCLRDDSTYGHSIFKECTDSSMGAKLLLNEEHHCSSCDAARAQKSSEKLSISARTPSSREDTNKRVPGVVARLMGLESLPSEETPFQHLEAESDAPESICFKADDFQDAKLLELKGPVSRSICCQGMDLESNCCFRSVTEQGLNSEKSQHHLDSHDTSFQGFGKHHSEESWAFLRTVEKVRSRRAHGDDSCSFDCLSASEVPCSGRLTVRSHLATKVHGSNWQREGRVEQHMLMADQTQSGLPFSSATAQASKVLQGSHHNQAERRLRENHCMKIDEEQKISDQQQIDDDGIFSWISNLQNEQFLNVENEVNLDVEQEQEESRIKLDIKWDSASIKGEEPLAPELDGWGLKFVEGPVTPVSGRLLQPSVQFRTSCQLKYMRGIKEEKDTGDEHKCTLLSKTKAHLDGSQSPHCLSPDAMVEEKVISGDLLNSSSKLFRVKRNGSDGDTSRALQQFLVRMRRRRRRPPILQHNCPPPMEASAAASESSDKPVSLARQNQSKICRPDGTVNISFPDAVEDRELITGSVPRELSSNRSKIPFGGMKKCLFHTRARSVDEVFPVLPLDESNLKPSSKEDDSSSIGSKISASMPTQRGNNEWTPDTFFADFEDSGCFTKRSSQFDHDKSDSSTIQQDHSSLHHLFMSDSEASLNPSPQGSKVSSLPVNDEDVLLLRDLDIDSSSSVCHSCSTPDNEESIHVPIHAGWTEDPVTPILVKKFLDKTDVPSLMKQAEEDNMRLQPQGEASMEECGQPSPVSILQSPFLDENLTTPEESVAESEHSLDGILEDGCTTITEPLLLNKDVAGSETSDSGEVLTSAIVESNKVRPALLDKCNFRTNNNNIVTRLNSAEINQQEEMHYIEEVLHSSDFLSTAKNATENCFGPDKVAISPLLFEQLQFRSTSSSQDKDIMLTDSVKWSSRDFVTNSWQGSLRQGDRRLLFDSLHEIVNMFCDLQFCSKGSPPASKAQEVEVGEKLVAKVYLKLCEWHNVATNAVQRLVDRDMRMHRSKWLEFSQEIAEVGTDIEHMLFKVMIDELLEDLYPGASKNWNIPLN